MIDQLKPILSTLLTVIIILTVTECHGTENNLYYPHITAKNNWETEICIINTSPSSPLSGQLIAYDNDGIAVDSKAISLEANARVEYTAGRDFQNPADIGYMILKSNAAHGRGYMKFYVQSRYRGAVQATPATGSTDIYIPHIASNDNWWTGISLLNTTEDSKTITLAFSDGSVQERTLAAGAHQVFSIKSLFSNAPQPHIHSAIIRNAGGIKGLALFASNPESKDNYLGGILITGETSENLYFPHIADIKTWWTGIVVYNPSEQAAQMTITPYKQDGTALTSQTMDIQSKERYRAMVGEMKFPEGAAWFHVAASRPLTGFQLFGTHDRNQLGGVESVNIHKTSGVFPKIEKDGWTGIAFVNTENSAVTVTLTAYADSGTVVDTRTVGLKAREKLLSTAPKLFAKDLSAATYIGFSSTGSIAGFQLNGTSDHMLLDALPGL